LREELEFIGKKYERGTPEETEQEKQRVLAGYDEFQLAKIVWLNNTYADEITKKPLWSVYNNNIHDYEVAKNKDLKNFKTEEVLSMLNSFIYAMETTMNTIRTFVGKYFDYWVEKGEVSINPLTGVKSMKSLTASKRLLETKIYNMDDFYEMLEQMKEVTSSIFIKPLLLARYGILGKQAIYMRNLKYKDIDTKNMNVNIYNENGEFLTLLPIDDKFINFLAKLDEVTEDESKEKLFKSDVYVLEPRTIVNYNTVNSRVYTAFKILNKTGREKIADWKDVERISFNSLLFTREIEILLKLRRERKITSRDVEMVIKVFNEGKINDASVAIMRKRYESLTEDRVLKKPEARLKNKTMEFQTVDPDSYQTVENICESIGIKID
jgi:hypothetical protein